MNKHSPLHVTADGSLPAGRAVVGGDGDVTHVAIGGGAMPVVLAGFDLNHVSHTHVVLFGFRGDDAVADGYHQNLVAAVAVPSGLGALFQN